MGEVEADTRSNRPGHLQTSLEELVEDLDEKETEKGMANLSCLDGMENREE
jgi:hypothetical protein